MCNVLPMQLQIANFIERQNKKKNEKKNNVL